MRTDLLELYGPWALVTGASSGIGEQFARLLAAQGFHLILVARREELLSALSKTLKQEHGIEVVIVAADLSLPKDVERVIETARQRDVGLIVSNAGFGLKGSFEKDSLQTLLSMVQVNALTPLILAREWLPQLAQRAASSKQRGGFIMTGSMEGEATFPWSSTYAATKAFVHSLGNGLWEEYRQRKVDVLVLAPGSTDTNAPISQGISRDQLVGLMSPEVVATQALQQLGRRPLWLTGLHNRMFIWLLRTLPRSIAIRMAGFGMKMAIENSANEKK